MGVKRHPADARASSTKSSALNGRRVSGPSGIKDEGTEFSQTKDCVRENTADRHETGRLLANLSPGRPGPADEGREKHGEGGKIATHSERLAHASLLWPASLTALAE